MAKARCRMTADTARYFPTLPNLGVVEPGAVVDVDLTEPVPYLEPEPARAKKETS